jgi:hypothetical protein
MLDTIAALMSPASLVLSLLSIFWVYRCSGAINHAHGLFAVIIFAFAIFQWYVHAQDPISTWHGILSAGFVMFSAGINVFYTHYLQLKVSVNRRRKQQSINHPDRRAS